MEEKLSKLAKLQQRDKLTAYTSLLSDTIQLRSPELDSEIVQLVSTVINEEHVGLVVARQVLNDLSRSMEHGDWCNDEQRKKLIQTVLSILNPRLVSFEEQASSLRYQLADILEREEDWSEAAHVLMGIPLESSNRTWSDQDKFKVYVRIVRLLLEDDDSVQAEVYYNRAALLAHHNTDRELSLMFKLSQARIYDYTRRFLEAASRYHELSWEGDIDEEERLHILSASVTCAVLAPAGPNRSRTLASLCRDERTSQLPNHNILTKMFLERILRSSEIQEFESTLKPHQLATIPQSSNDRLASLSEDRNDRAEETGSKRNGPETVLDRAVMEHNLLSCSKIYNNITFSGLGSLLDLRASAAETMARRMIEQGRLRGSIDQVARLLWFEASHEDEDAQGKAGGLGEVEQRAEDTGAPFVKRWDKQIRMTSNMVESIAQSIGHKGLTMHT